MNLVFEKLVRAKVFHGAKTFDEHL
jgi:hypothetical protein